MKPNHIIIHVEGGSVVYVAASQDTSVTILDHDHRPDIDPGPTVEIGGRLIGYHRSHVPGKPTIEPDSYELQRLAR